MNVIKEKPIKFGKKIDIAVNNKIIKKTLTSKSKSTILNNNIETKNTIVKAFEETKKNTDIVELNKPDYKQIERTKKYIKKTEQKNKHLNKDLNNDNKENFDNNK